jgi:hypothetical protein
LTPKPPELDREESAGTVPALHPEDTGAPSVAAELPSSAGAPASAKAFQAEIYQLQRELFHANQKLINQAVEGYTDEFRRYETRYHRALRRPLGPIAYADVLRRTRLSRVTLVGDYHTFTGAQRAFHRLLHKQPAADRRVIVALEMLLGRHQELIDRYVRGEISEATFLRRTEHHRHWPFGPFDAIRPVFELAKKRRWRVIGIDQLDPGASSLNARDEFAAERIVAELVQDPGARLFALVGEMHLAPAHLPRALSRAMRKSRTVKGPIYRIHQNPDSIWFDLAAKGQAAEHEVIAIDENACALLSASPVVCQQSFLTWLEQAEDGTPEAPIVHADAGRRSVRQAVRAIGRALHLPVADALRRVQVVGPADLSFFEELRESGLFSNHEMRQIRAQILASESYYIPKARVIYLATLSLSHAAEEAAHMLRHHFSGEGLDDPKGLVDAFYSRIMNEAIGFLGSKIVNPNRRSVRVPELTEMASLRAHGDSPPDPFEVASAALALEHKRMEQGQRVPKLARVFHASPELFIAVTHILGYILGDELYAALARGTLPPKEARSLFYEPFEDEGAALLLYFELVHRTTRRRA